jgi:gliding motility-associated-like protein
MGAPPAKFDFNNGNVGSATFTGTCVSTSFPACNTQCPLFACVDVSNAGPDQTVCATTATLAGNTPSSGNGTWTLISGSGTITTPNSPTSGLTGLGVGANTFRWTINCDGSTDDVVITRTATPTASAAGPDQTVCATTATLAGNTAATGTGTWTLVGGSGTITTPSSPTSGVTGLGVGANVFRWTIANSPCTASTDDVTITRTATPTTSAAGPDQNICATTATLAGNTATTGTGTWTLVSGSGTITTPSSPTSGLTGLGIGANVFRWTIANAPCTASTDDVTINVSGTPTTSAAGPDQTLCNVTIATLAGNTPVTGTGTWTLVSGSGTITTPSSPTSGLTGLGVGANVFRWTIANAPCTASSDDVTITIKALPTTANAGPDQSVCNINGTLAGNTPVNGTGTWTLVSGSGTISSPSSPTSGITGLGTGPNVFRWTISNPPCASTSDDVTIDVSATPSTADAGPDQTLCSVTTTTLAGNTPASGTGSWSLVSGSGSATTPSSPTSGVTGLAVGPNVFRWTINGGACANLSDDVTITIKANPTVANAGPDQTLCTTSNSTTLAGNTAVIGTGTWTLVSGTGTITTPSSPTSAVTGLGIGNNVFRWTIVNAPCASTTNDVTITIKDIPTVANAGPDQTICISSPTVTLAGNAPTVGTGTWTLVSGTGTITTPSSPTSTVTGLAVGANVFRWTISNAPCASTTNDVTINVNDVPTVSNAGPDQTLCITSNSTSLAGNTPTVGTGTWTRISGSGTIASPTSPNSGVSGLGVGNNVFRWTITNPPCAASTNDVTIIIKDVPTVANAGPDQTLCITSNSTTLAGNAPTVGVGTWTLVSGSGTITTPASPTSTVTGLGVGANVFRWTINDAPCAVSSDDVTINVNDVPTVANAGPDQTLCANNTALAGNLPTVGTGTWTLVSGTGTIANPSNPNSLLNGFGVGTNIFRWTVSNPPCADSFDDVKIIVSSVPTSADAGQDQTVCISSPTATLAGNTPTSGSGTWTKVSGSGTITTPTSPTSGVTGLAVGPNVFRWSINNAPCAATTDDVTINVSANPSASNAGPDQTICQASPSTTLAGNNPAIGSGTWTRVSGTGTITTPTSPTSGVTGLGVGPNVFRWTVSNPPCTPTTDDVTINVSGNPTTSNAGPDQTICQASPSTSLAGNTPTTGTGTWTLVSGSGTIAGPTLATTLVTGLGVGANVFRWTITNPPCAPSTDDVTINVSGNPTVADAGPDQTVCITSPTATLAGNTPTVGTGTWTLVSGTGTITTPTSPTSGVTGLALGANVFRWTVSNAPCASTTNDVIINVNNVPTVSAAGPDQTVCSTTATLAGNTPTIGTGTWTLVSGTGTVNSPNSPTSSLSGLAVGPNVFRWTISNPPCASTTDDVTITVSANPTTSNAGPDQFFCSTTTTSTLAGNTPAAGAGTWSLVSGTGTIANPALPNSGVTGLTIGANVFRWTINSGACANVKDDITITILAPVTLTKSTTNVNCFADNTGAIDLTVAGGMSPYTYSWSNTKTTEDLSGLTSGTYTVLVTDKIGCTGTTSITITQPTAALAAVSSATSVTCKGSGNGSTSVVATGGTPVYTYLWSPVGGTAATTSSLSGGIYTVTVTDANGCSQVTSVTVNESTALLNSGITNNIAVTCKGSKNGTLTVTPTGGTLPYTYNWTPAGGTASTASGLAGGTYTVTVKDKYGCSTTTTALVNESTLALNVVMTQNTPVTCKGSSNGTLVATPVGGTSPYTYNWSPVGGNGRTASGLSGGSYTISVTDQYGCDTTLVAKMFESATRFNANIASTIPVTCTGSSDGSIVVSATGGTKAYTYSWSPIGGSSLTASNLPGGIYGITVTDSTGCDTVLTAIVNESTKLLRDSVINIKNVTCTGSSDGILTTTPVGGTLPYTYSWSPVGGTAAIASGLPGGTYTVTVKDAYGCSDTKTATVNESIISLTDSIVSTDAGCKMKNGTVAVFANGGTSPFVYQWSPNTSTTSSDSGLGGGTYTVTVTDLYGCAVTATATVNAPPSPTAGFTPSPDHGNSPLTVDFANNSLGGLTYLWVFGDGSQDTVFNPSHVYDTPGSYTVKLYVTNAFGCMDSTEYTFIKVTQKSMISVPNVFTPNGDNFNDIFYITSKGLKTLQVEIFDRWGLKLYEFDTINGSWDGRNNNGVAAPDGTYYWILKAEGDDGDIYNMHGFLTLIR